MGLDDRRGDMRTDGEVPGDGDDSDGEVSIGEDDEQEGTYTMAAEDGGCRLGEGKNSRGLVERKRKSFASQPLIHPRSADQYPASPSRSIRFPPKHASARSHWPVRMLMSFWAVNLHSHPDFFFQNRDYFPSAPLAAPSRAVTRRLIRSPGADALLPSGR